MVNWKMTAIYFGRKWDKRSLILNLIKSFWRSIAKFKIVKARKIRRTCNNDKKIYLPTCPTWLSISAPVFLSSSRYGDDGGRLFHSFFLFCQLTTFHRRQSEFHSALSSCLAFVQLWQLFEATARGPLRAFFVESAHGVDFCRRANVIRWPIRQSRSGHFLSKKKRQPPQRKRELREKGC